MLEFTRYNWIRVEHASPRPFSAKVCAACACCLLASGRSDRWLRTLENYPVQEKESAEVGSRSTANISSGNRLTHLNKWLYFALQKCSCLSVTPQDERNPARQKDLDLAREPRDLSTPRLSPSPGFTCVSPTPGRWQSWWSASRRL